MLYHNNDTQQVNYTEPCSLLKDRIFSADIKYVDTSIYILAGTDT